jgi:hypothetical protein
VLSLLPLSRYLVKKEGEDTGIVWNTRIRVEEFINISLKKFAVFSETCLEVKEKLGKAYEAGNQIRIVAAGISISTV